MKKIVIIVIIILLIAITWFSWNKMNTKEVIQETPQQVLDKATQADTTDEIEVKLDSLDTDTNSSADFDGIDAEIKSI